MCTLWPLWSFTFNTKYHRLLLGRAEGKTLIFWDLTSWQCLDELLCHTVTISTYFCRSAPHLVDCSVTVFWPDNMMMVWYQDMIVIFMMKSCSPYISHQNQQRLQIPNHWRLASCFDWSRQPRMRDQCTNFSFLSPDWNRSSLLRFAQPQPKNWSCRSPI